jgi:hypothetical protein
MQTRRERRRARQRRFWWTAGSIALVLILIITLVVVLRSDKTSRPASTKHSQPVRGTHLNRTTKALPATFQGPDGVEARWVIQQNELPGTTKWEITTPQTPGSIEGYANRVQARLGQKVTLFVSTVAKSFHVDAYRMGYYQGKGARLIWRSRQIPGFVQASCPVTPGINMVQCFWKPSLSFTITKAWVQGQYLLKLVGSGGQQSYVPLTVWDPSSHATYVLMAGVATWQVFNPFGGYDLYQGATACAPNHYPCSTRSRVVSFDRPYGYGNGAASFLGEEYPLLRFMEKHGLNVTYWTDILLATHGNLLKNHKVLISPGHDEEWSLRMRQAAVKARDEGVNLIFMGASPILRKIRFEPSPLGADMEVVNYRNPQADPLYGKDNARVTQNWWGQPPANLPASTLVGEAYSGVGYNNQQVFPLVVADASSWLYQGTGLVNGQKVPNVLTADFDQYNPNRAGNPPDVEILAHSPVVIQFDGAHKFADTSYYTWRPSNAGVFESGANSWIPSLERCPATTPASQCPAPIMRKLTGNLMRVFGEGPVGLHYPSHANWQQFYG